MGLGSEIRDPGQGVKKAPDPGSGSATLVPACTHSAVERLTISLQLHVHIIKSSSIVEQVILELTAPWQGSPISLQQDIHVIKSCCIIEQVILELTAPWTGLPPTYS
jgi:hypothetical protein